MKLMNIREHILKLAKKSKGRIILPESFDPRVLKAAEMLTKNEIASVVLPMYDIDEVKKTAAENDIDLDGIEIIKMEQSLLDMEKIENFVAARMKKGMSKQEILELLKNPLYFSMMYLKSGKCDACVSGAVYNTADVLRAAIHVIGPAEGVNLVSSYFVMIPPENHPIIKEPVIFTDCAVNPDPQAPDLKDIAALSIKNFKKLFPDKQVNVAMLSFSTLGSAKNVMLDKVIKATELLKKDFEGQSAINIDGELQIDASVIASVGKRKAPNSTVAGNANILVFPDLNAGNIGYKIAERFAGFQALGPIMQGLALPVSDLSRGSTPDDIYLVSSITLLK
jgi:phosphate acetyltransferase